MRELVKSTVSFSWALSLAGIRAAGAMANRTQRDLFLKDTESMLNKAIDDTVNTLGRNLRETYEFGDTIQRRVIDSGLGALAAVVPRGRR
jgi:hypothetical protein